MNDVSSTEVTLAVIGTVGASYLFGWATASPFVVHVADVVGLSSDKKMFGIEARGIVASVQHEQRAVNIESEMQRSREPMRQPAAVIHNEHPIALVVTVAGPVPASGYRVDFAITEQPILYGRLSLLQRCMNARLRAIQPPAKPHVELLRVKQLAAVLAGALHFRRASRPSARARTVQTTYVPGVEHLAALRAWTRLQPGILAGHRDQSSRCRARAVRISAGLPRARFPRSQANFTTFVARAVCHA